MAGTIEKCCGKVQLVMLSNVSCGPNGEYQNLAWVRVPQFDEPFQAFMRTAMDHTEHEHLIHELQRREAYLAEAQRLSHTGSFGWKISTNKIFSLFLLLRMTKEERRFSAHCRRPKA